MKLVIPPEIQMGAYKIKIRFNDKTLKRMGKRAWTNDREQIILLSHYDAEIAIFADLIHEIRHFSDFVGGIDTEEGIVVASGNAIAQCLLSMGIEPDFSQLPEEE